MQINRIQTSDVARITSGQVIIELLSVVKELVENSIDAGSSKIDVTFHNYGINSVEVNDDGRGIEKEDFESLCLKHYTSKLETFEDISHVRTLGFRGEAMSSLCSVAKVKIATCTKSSYPKATELEYDNLGRLISQKTKVTGKRGTSVIVSGLFHDLPVRQKNFAKHAKREYSKCLSILMGYLLGYTHIRFAVYNVNETTAKKSMTLGSSGGKVSVHDVLTSIYGSNGAHGLIPVDIKVENIDARFKLGSDTVPSALSINVTGLISDFSFGMGRGGTDRQYLYINKRPVTHKRFGKAINDVYRAFNSTQFPVYVLNIDISTSFVDQNVTPDKRSVLVQNEELVSEVLREELINFFDTRHNSVPKNSLACGMHETQKNENNPDGGANGGYKRDDVLEDALGLASSKEITVQPHQAQNFLLLQECTSPEYVQAEGAADMTKSSPLNSKVTLIAQDSKVTQVQISVSDDNCPGIELEDNEMDPLEIGEAVCKVMETHPAHLHTVDSSPNAAKSLENRYLLGTASLTSMQDKAEMHEPQFKAIKPLQKEISRIESGGTLASNYLISTPRKNDGAIVDDFSDVNDQVLESLFVEEMSPSSKKQVVQDSASTFRPRCNVRREYCINKFRCTPKPSEHGRTATQLLLVNVQDIQQTLEIHKEDFLNMQVVGQFNLGFIVVIHDNRLFIVDQHALDEIFNYEHLMQSLVLRAQPLVAPRVLELSSIDEMVLLENKESLRQNGFVVEENMEGIPGRRVRLIALPVLKNVVFDDGDLHELMHKLHENGFSYRASAIETGARRTVRCTKVDEMIALRACRKSIMIGQSLNKRTMARVIRHLSELEKPWNCPHGRPTMRHLADLELLRFDADYLL